MALPHMMSAELAQLDCQSKVASLCMSSNPSVVCPGLLTLWQLGAQRVKASPIEPGLSSRTVPQPHSAGQHCHWASPKSRMGTRLHLFDEKSSQGFVAIFNPWAASNGELGFESRSV